jgi:hypothetical protein
MSKKNYGEGIKREGTINKMKMQFVRCSILFLAVAVLTIGILNREYEAVFYKAIKICLECIGIG